MVNIYAIFLLIQGEAKVIMTSSCFAADVLKTSKIVFRKVFSPVRVNVFPFSHAQFVKLSFIWRKVLSPSICFGLCAHKIQTKSEGKARASLCCCCVTWALLCFFYHLWSLRNSISSDIIIKHVQSSTAAHICHWCQIASFPLDCLAVRCRISFFPKYLVPFNYTSACFLDPIFH